MLHTRGANAFVESRFIQVQMHYCSPNHDAAILNLSFSTRPETFSHPCAPDHDAAILNPISKPTVSSIQVCHLYIPNHDAGSLNPSLYPTSHLQDV